MIIIKGKSQKVASKRGEVLGGDPLKKNERKVSEKKALKQSNGWSLIRDCKLYTIFPERTSEGHHQSDEHWSCFKGNIGETSARRVGTHNYELCRAHGYHLELNWTEQGLHCTNITQRMLQQIHLKSYLAVSAAPGPEWCQPWPGLVSRCPQTLQTQGTWTMCCLTSASNTPVTWNRCKF